MQFVRALTPLLALLLCPLVFADADCNDAQPPSQDPWYTLPKGVDCSGAPGKVLRLRRAPKTARESLRGIRDAWNVLFCSTDSAGEPTFSVTTVLVPHDADSKALVTYPPAYDSASVDSSPSYALSNLVGSSIEQAIFTPLIVSKRWVVNMPDYEGPRAAYLAGNNSGHGLLDSIRAVRSLHDLFGLCPDFQHAVYGYSGGAFASQWAAQLQPSYAPELDIGTMAYGGLAVNATSVIPAINGGPAAGLVVLALLGTTAQSQMARMILAKNLRKTGLYNSTTFFSALKMDSQTAMALFQNQDISKYFVEGFSFMKEPAFVHAFYDDTLAGRGDTPTIPMYVFHGVKDNISPIKDMDELVQKYCAAGTSIEYRRNVVGDHGGTGIAEGIRALNWLGGFFAGAHQQEKCCHVHDVTSALGPDSVALAFIVFSKQGYRITQFLKVHALPGVPSIPSNATNAEVFIALRLTTRASLAKIGLNDQALAQFHVSEQDLAELGIH
ncbi:hypothetical protein MY3296_005557 [Beauveria thailandica]